MRISEAIEEFLLDQRIRGNSPETWKYYRHCLQFFQDFTGDRAVDEITILDCKRYYVMLAERELSSVSVQSYIRALRAFLTWLYENEYHAQNIPARFKLPKAQRKIVDVLTDEEVRQLYDFFDERELRDLRNLCIISLMLDSGLRLSEVVTAERRHLHLDERYLIVTGKGNKQRIVPFGSETARLLSLYVDRTPGPLSLLVKVSRPSSGDYGEPITHNTLKMLFKELQRSTGIPRLHAHLLRHTFATRYLENGGNIYGLQAILGHSSLEMCKRYLHLSSTRICTDFAVRSPLDCIKKEGP